MVNPPTRGEFDLPYHQQPTPIVAANVSRLLA